MRRRSTSSIFTRSIPSKRIEPAVIRQPGRAYPIAASPIVDLPAPDSPISPSTSPRRSVKSMPLTISLQRSSLCPSMRKPRIASRIFPVSADRSIFAARSLTLIFQPTRLVQQPVDHEIDGDGEERDRARREQRRNVAVIDEGSILADHRAPVGGRRLDAESEEGQRADRQEDEAESQAELDDERRQDIGQDLAAHDP